MTSFSVTPFLELLYEESIRQTLEPLERLGDWEAYQQEQLERIRNLLALPRLMQLRTPLSRTVTEEWEQEGIRIRKYQVDGIQSLSLCVHVLLPASLQPLRRDRAVLFLCGHDNRGAAGAYTPCTEGEKTLPIALAGMGYLVLIPEFFGFGEAKRKEAPEETGACESCAQITPWLLNCGMNLLGIRVFETMVTMDFAQQEFGAERFCAYGISGGGHVCNYAGVLDERIDAMVVSGYPNLYRYSTLAVSHCICNYVPGQMTLGESYYVTALAAPHKKLCVMNGDKDPIFPKKGSELVFPYLQRVYEGLGAADNYEAVLFDGGHQVAVQEVCDWMRRNVPAEND